MNNNGLNSEFGGLCKYFSVFFLLIANFAILLISTIFLKFFVDFAKKKREMKFLKRYE